MLHQVEDVVDSSCPLTSAPVMEAPEVAAPSDSFVVIHSPEHGPGRRGPQTYDI